MNSFYYYIGNAAICLICIFALLKTTNGSNTIFKSDNLFMAGICFFLLIAKLSPFHAGMLNIDESIMLCGGRTLAFDPRAWISVDPTTSGPLNFLPAMIVTKVLDWGSYGELRLFYVLAFQIPTILILFYTFRKISNSYFARLAIIPLVLTLGFFYFTDLIHASSENFPMLFMAILLSIVLRLSFNFKISKWNLIIAGTACAASFYVKLQVTPIFLYLTGACFILLFFIRNEKKDSLIFIFSFAATQLAALAIIWLYGGFYDFVQSYLIGNLRYTTANLFTADTVKTFLKSGIRSLLPILSFALLLIGIVRNVVKKPLTLIDLLYHAGFILTILITVYSIMKPGRYYLHYITLVIVPLYSYLVWLLLKYGWTPGRFLIPAASVVIALIFYVNVKNADRAVENEKQHLDDIINPKLVNNLLANRKPEDRIAVWGWGSYYVHAGRLLMGTRDVHFDFQTSYQSDLGQYYRDRYLADLEKNNPRWFLDLSLPGGLLTNESCELKHYPQIDNFVKQHYQEVYRSGFEVLYEQKTK